jgi:TPR repeat protein
VEEDTMELLREEEEEGANEIWEDELLQEPHPAADVFEKAEDLLYANEEREGGDDDLKECLQLLARAAIRKNPDAVWRLSELALLGKGLKNGPHLGLAAHYALRGCEMDAAPTSPGGMLALGHGFETGFGFPQKKRHLKALYWYEQAVEGGYEELGEEGMARVRADYTEDGFEEDEEFPALPASTADITDVDVIEEMMRVQEAPLQGNNYETLDELQGAMDAEHPGNNYDTHVDAHNYNASALDAFGMEFGTGEK